MLDGYRCFKVITTVCVSFGRTPIAVRPVSWRGPRISILYFPGARTISKGVRPTIKSLMKISAPSGEDRNRILPAFSPALSSSSLRFNSDGGGPVLARRCGEEPCAAGVARVVEGDFAVCAVILEFEVTMPASAIACAWANCVPNTSKPRNGKINQILRISIFSKTLDCWHRELSSLRTADHREIPHIVS